MNNGKPASNRQLMWKRIVNFKIGIVPLGIYVPVLFLTYLVMSSGKLPKDMMGAMPVMMLMGFAFAEIGKRAPVLKDIGGSAILAIFLPSFLVAHNLIPLPALDSIVTFMKSTNFLYVNFSMIVVGSILGMDRVVLVQGFIRMFGPLLAGTLTAMLVGVGVGILTGIGAYKSFFFIVVPIMAGGLAEGAIPLSMAYAEILHSTPEQFFGQIVPGVMLGSLSAIILAGLLKKLGEQRPELTGRGKLVKAGDDTDILGQPVIEEKPFDLQLMGAGALTSTGFYLLGIFGSQVLGMPGPILMIFSATAIKALGWLPKEVENGAYMMYRFFLIIVTFPLLIGIGAVYTPWKDIVAVLNPEYLITIFLTVLSMTASGFFAGKYLNMYPIEAALVTACHSGQGSTGDLAILTASDRMILMPFAQVSTRIGGACTVVIAAVLLRWLQ